MRSKQQLEANTECKRCGHSWYQDPDKDPRDTCPGCNSPFYDRVADHMPRKSPVDPRRGWKR